uniref:Flavanone 3-dioxygenase 3-like n=1 Tax=Elaeis guineensis var. tenera TaxID=51953 RepID=A0A6I9SDZ6_ELAGV|nr:flavanone 3-dioxygenase 3-like [Elaeis guineensis]
MKGALEAASGFLEMPEEAKEEFALDDFTKHVRYDTSSGNGTDKARAFLKHYAHPLSKWVQFWLLEPQGCREKMGQYAIESRRLAIQLLDAILESLGLGHGYLNDKLEEGIQLIAMNSYSKSSQLAEMVELAPRSDYGFLTILLQNYQGLQVMESNGEAWSAVPQVPEALHVHIGDYQEVLSNGLYKGVVYRVVLNGEKQRISIASIQSLSMDEKVEVAKK